jgi:hypothetical protein
MEDKEKVALKVKDKNCEIIQLFSQYFLCVRCCDSEDQEKNDDKAVIRTISLFHTAPGKFGFLTLNFIKI